MYVIKRNNTEEPASFEQITDRITELSVGLNVDASVVSQKVISGVYSGISTAEIDELTCETLAAMITVNPDYEVLASKVAISNLHKQTNPSFSETELSVIDDERIKEIIRINAQKLDSTIKHANDYDISYFGLKTLENNYLLKDRDNKAIVERPQYIFMRTALEIHRGDIESVIETYEMMSEKRVSTPLRR